ncbi:oligopeptide/dipeptide ABC transporter ATP-binding protein [Abyssibacter sp.]|uniref:oligopeptide/dipeptide ABC transporter ATP-binding protein n=1 Tax=Abyssibacter sp. TaxID=2320200 RepID=UPI00351288AA
MLLAVNNLDVRFTTEDGIVQAVNGLNFSLDAGATLGIVGESGSGKSQTALAIMGLLASNGEVSGSIQFKGEELVGVGQRRMNSIRGAHIGMIFQDPMTSLNPYLKVSTQMAEVLVRHRGMGKREAVQESIKMLDAVRIPDAKSRILRYPHEFSGGMRQRVMIAMTLLTRPELLIADEPTTAVDVTVQAQILDLLSDLRDEFGVAIVMITHDLGVVADVCDEVLVLYGGQIMEQADARTLFKGPTHPYTRGLLDSIPSLDSDHQSELVAIPGNPPDLLHLPPGCPFEARCAWRHDPCPTHRPVLEAVETAQHRRACHASVAEVRPS